MPNPFEVDDTNLVFRAACERLGLSRRQIDLISRAIYMQARGGIPPLSPVRIAMPVGRKRDVAATLLWVTFDLSGDRITLRNVSEDA